MRTQKFALAVACLAALSLVACDEEGEPPSVDGELDAAAHDAAVKDASVAKLDARVADTDHAVFDASPVDASSKPDAHVAPPDAGLRPKCVKKDTQVMIIGDSYINWLSHTFPRDIVDVTKQHWRMEAIGGYSMGSGGIGLIGDQYKASITKDPDCHTILMNGGGNDALVPDLSIDPFRQCLEGMATTLPQCQKIIDTAIAAADALLRQASAAGVRDVVYFFYPHVPQHTLLGGSKPNVMLDFAKPQVKTFCDGVEAETHGNTRCTFIDMMPVFEGHDDWFFPGDIHEITPGSQAMAKKIWQVMQSKCIGQPTGSGCCEE